MTVLINEKDLQKLVNNAVVSVLNSLNITKKEGDLENLPLPAILRVYSPKIYCISFLSFP